MMAGLNHEINPSVETVFIESPAELRDVSSTAVRLIVGPEAEHITLLLEQGQIIFMLQALYFQVTMMEFLQTILSVT
jgi:phosphopantetheine adenylyltransferase